MRRLYMLSAFLATVVFTWQGANAQQICGVIAKYFINAPAGFISERGPILGPGRWKSNLNFPNASCYIRESKFHEHEVSCVINSGADVAVIAQWGKLVEHDIDKCLQQIPNGSDYVKTQQTDNSTGLTAR